MCRHRGAFRPIDAVSEHLEPAERRATVNLSEALGRGGLEIAQIGRERAETGQRRAIGGVRA